MIIAINTIVLRKKKQIIYNDFFSQYFYSLAKKKPDNQFIFIVDESFDSAAFASKNIEIIKVKSPSNTLSLQLWQGYQLPKIIQKTKADIVISTNFLYAVKTKTTQFLVVDNLSAINQSKRKNLETFTTAEKIIVTSPILKTAIVELYKIDEQKVSVIYTGAADNYNVLSWEEREEVLKKKSNGKEYFLYVGETGEENNLLSLLKAFSLFKKWQKSNMQLIIATKENIPAKYFSENIQNYKLRNDVITLCNITDTELAEIYSAAYCFINPIATDNYIPLLQSMQSGVPVITVNNGICKEVCDDAVLYATINSIADISTKMILVYKDETKRNELIEKGKILSQQYGYNNTIDAINQELY